MKIISKQKLKLEKQIEHLYAERAVLGEIDHPFISKMIAAF